MKKFRVSLSRDYVVLMSAENENDAKSFVEQYVSGGSDDSTQAARKRGKFKIENIKPTSNDAWFVEELE